jgi:heterodisulfide reductase subunit D
MSGETPVSPAVPGAGYRVPFTPRQLLELDACTRCGECLRACDSFRVKGDEGVALMGMIRQRRTIFKQDNSLLRKLLHRNGSSEDAWDKFQEGVFSCTLCGRCAAFCPVGIRTRDLALTMRQELATARCTMPKNLGVAREAVLEEGNVFRFPNEDRAMWAEFMDDLPEDLLGKESADVLYFVGCVSSFSPAVQEIPQAFLRVLLRAGVDVALMAGEEQCCGFPLIVGGLADEASKVIEHNIEQAIHRLGAKTVVFNCPSCYYTWKRYYPLEGVRLVHSTQFIRDLVRSGRLKFERSDLAVTYHDPCDLGRGAGEYEAPREVLRAFGGGNYVELTPSGERALCCGGGGDVEMWDPDLVGEINGMLTDAVERSEARLVVQACPQCKRTTQRGLEERKSDIRTMDIAEMALEYGTFENEDA